MKSDAELAVEHWNNRQIESALSARIAEFDAELGRLREALRGLIEIDFLDAIVACQQWVRRKEDAEEALKGGE